MLFGVAKALPSFPAIMAFPEAAKKSLGLPIIFSLESAVLEFEVIYYLSDEAISEDHITLNTAFLIFNIEITCAEMLSVNTHHKVRLCTLLDHLNFT